jgi:hypothetical protein
MCFYGVLILWFSMGVDELVLDICRLVKQWSFEILVKASMGKLIDCVFWGLWLPIVYLSVLIIFWGLYLVRNYIWTYTRLVERPLPWFGYVVVGGYRLLIIWLIVNGGGVMDDLMIFSWVLLVELGWGCPVNVFGNGWIC